ncbi:retinol dehydrogenase 12-like [Thalassophryne amazonica]|uniref:retinol dehydrogenase 12-like n=1 Tax=Thalassophryne amazonica TaxID=390379 RepID=UPI001471A048|nr:retinol dehydrogenase 12-like [Thalassophryne amazonica]
MADFLVVVAVLIGIAYIYHHVVVKGQRCTSRAKLHGKTVIVTGSNTGIGKMTAIDLARRGARVIMACRSKQKGEVAVLEVKMESRSENVTFMQLDLASLKSVRSFAEIFLKTEPRLDVLINNAGVYMQGQTEDGLGLMFGVNHIGHFLLTHLLLDRLKECGPSRVVNVSSSVHNCGNIDFDCLNTHKALRLGTSFWSVMKIYSDSKLCNVLFTHELARRLQGTKVTCYSLHPGVIRSELARNLSSVLVAVLKPVTTFFFKSTEQGAQTTLHCALQEGLEPLSGRYFSNCTVRNLSAKATDDGTSKKLWELSERLCVLPHEPTAAFVTHWNRMKFLQTFKRKCLHDKDPSGWRRPLTLSRFTWLQQTDGHFIEVGVYWVSVWLVAIQDPRGSVVWWVWQSAAPKFF